MRDPQSAQQRVVVALVGTGLMLLGKASGLFGSGTRLNIPILVLVVAVLLMLFVHPSIRYGENKKPPNMLTSRQITGTAFVLIGLALAVKITVDAFWGKVPEYSFLFMGLGAMVVLFLLPLAKARKEKQVAAARSSNHHGLSEVAPRSSQSHTAAMNGAKLLMVRFGSWGG